MTIVVKTSSDPEKRKPKWLELVNFPPWDWLHILGVVLILGAILGVNYGDVGLAVSGIPLGSLLLYTYVKRKMTEPKKKADKPEDSGDTEDLDL